MQLSNICTVKLCPDLVFLSDLPYQPEKCKETCPRPRQRSRCVLWCFPQPEYQRPDRSSTSRMTRSCTSVPSAAASQHSVGWQSLLWNKGKQRLSFQQRQPAGFWLLPYHDCVCVCCRGGGGGGGCYDWNTDLSFPISKAAEAKQSSNICYCFAQLESW